MKFIFNQWQLKPKKCRFCNRLFNPNYWGQTSCNVCKYGKEPQCFTRPMTELERLKYMNGVSQKTQLIEQQTLLLKQKQND